jgi:glyoxylase-like metal-dependent hydrolase (beta-lactamase superfamily II)
MDPQSQHPQEHDHPGWRSLRDLLQKEGELFDNTLFLEGYHFSSNIYVIKGDYISIIDPGNDYTAFMDLFALGLEPGSIKKIATTHGHQDHVMGTFELLRSYPSISAGGSYELLLHEGGPAELKEMARRFGCQVTELKGGETIELSGFDWEVIHTPGHTIDGLCFYNAPSKTLTTGDVVMPHAMAEVDQGAGGRIEHYLYALRTLLKRDVENILPGHGNPIAETGRRVIEESYEGVIFKFLGIEVEGEKRIPWFDGACSLAERGFLEESVYCCDKELALDPGNVNALQLKAMGLNDLGRCTEAIEVLDEILTRQEDNVFALVGKGYAYLGLGTYSEAIKYLDDALALRPDMKEAKVYKGMALYLAGRYEEAMNIQEFQTEFVDRFKQEIERKDEET